MSETPPPASLPGDPNLAAIATAMESARGASCLFDREVTLVWVSRELRKLLGDPSDEELCLGRHVVEAYLSPVWSSTISLESQLQSFPKEFPMIVAETRGGKAGLRDIFLRAMEGWQAREELGVETERIPEIVDQLFEYLEPVDPPPIWTSEFEYLQADLPPVIITEKHIRLHDDVGSYIGTAVFFDPGLPASVLTLVARGDEAMFTRMARLIEPGARQAAILFADLQASALLSSRLPSPTYFSLVRAITTAMDQSVADHNGIVGKHGGDGVTAFFLVEDLGSASSAVRAAVSAARTMAEAVERAAKDVGAGTGLIEAADCKLNVGLHWGESLYMGQVVTGGRLEVTALGDRVNEAARIQQTAADGEILASKGLIEQLSGDDAAALGLDPGAILYRKVSELDAASPKAIRDAGGVPVTVL
jgi:class 3 adenylate cyclase